MTSSSLSQLDFRVESFKFGAGLVVGESPVDTFLAFVAIGGPGGAAAGDFGGGVDAVGEALSGQNAQLGFGHVEPTAVLGGVHDLDAIGDAERFFGAKGLIERSNGVSVQVVADQRDPLSLCESRSVDQFANSMSPVDGCLGFGDQDITPSGKGLHEHPDVATPLADVFEIDFLRLAGLHGQG